MKVLFMVLILSIGISCVAQATDSRSTDSQAKDKCPSFGKDPDKYPALKVMVGHIQQFIVQSNEKRSTLPDIDVGSISVLCDVHEIEERLEFSSNSDRTELENALAFFSNVNGHPGRFFVNLQSPMFIAADRAFKNGNAGIDLVIAEGQIFSQFTQWHNMGKVSATEAKSLEIAYVSQGFDKLSPVLKADPIQQSRAKDYLSKLKSQEPKN